MALIDRVKAQAAQLAQKAQDAGKAGQIKLEDAQARRHVDGLLRDLGSTVFAMRTGRGDADATAKVETLISELKDYEAQHGVIASSGLRDEPESQPGDAGSAPEGDFKLDS